MFTGNLDEENIRIKIVGVGGAGTNAVDRLKLDQEKGLHLATINTDAQSLAESPVQEKLMIGRSLTRGLSTGGEVELGRKAAEADSEAIRKMVQGMDIIFLLAGLGGGTGSGAAPVVGRIASEQGVLVIAFVTLPFTLEGERRHRYSADALAELRQNCDAVIPLPNDLLLQYMDEKATVLDAFSQADAWIGRGVRSICSMLTKTGLINIDFATLRKSFVNKGGKTLFGLGRGEGVDAVKEAINDLMLCPLLHTPEHTRKADDLVVNIMGGTDLGIKQVNEIMAAVVDKFGSRENTVLGAVIDESLQSEVEICVIGTTDLSGSEYMRKMVKPRTRSLKPLPASGESVETSSSGAEVKIPTHKSPVEASTVHQSKLKKEDEKTAVSDQEEFHFITEDEQRGFFDKTDKNLWEGEDLDVPTYLRRGIRIVV